MSGVDTIRRVYELPAETVEAIQTEAVVRGEAEVTVVRRLLREALAHRETGKDLAIRARRFAISAGLIDTLRMLTLHCQVVSITKDAGRAEIRCVDGHVFEVTAPLRSVPSHVSTGS